ncbi:DUF3367 domain-containing protein, partial [Streptomyces sp. DSM 41528]|nr:DUF3367 domain-containing protein [Streptomyces sp. DSM 41528]
YLQMYENANDGWQATLNGHRLTPLRVDGWQQGFLVPAGAGGTVELSYAPAGLYDAGLIGGAAAVALLAVCALVRRGTPQAAQPAELAPAAPSWVLGVVALTGVMALAAGPYAVIVPLLALAARFRPALLGPLALAAMAGAGVIAALGAGEPVAAGRGAFSGAAQALALLALAAAVVTVPPTRPAASRSLPSRPAPARTYGRASDGQASDGQAPAGRASDEGEGSAR